MQLAEALGDSKEDKDKLEIFLNEKGDKAIAQVPGWAEEFMVRARRDDQWLILSPPERNATGPAFSAGMLTGLGKERLRKVRMAIEDCDNIDKIRTKLKEIVNAPISNKNEKKSAQSR
jgi:hypothetical protein